MLLRREAEPARRAPAPDLDVVGLVRPVRHVVRHDVGQPHQQLGQGGVLGPGLVVQRGDLALLLGHQCAQAFELGLVAPGFGRADFLRGPVGLGLGALGGGDRGAARFVERQHLARHPRETAARHRGVEQLRGVSDHTDVVHGALPIETWISPPICRRPTGKQKAKTRGQNRMWLACQPSPPRLGCAPTQGGRPPAAQGLSHARLARFRASSRRPRRGDAQFHADPDDPGLRDHVVLPDPAAAEEAQGGRGDAQRAAPRRQGADLRAASSARSPRSRTTARSRSRSPPASRSTW